MEERPEEPFDPSGADPTSAPPPPPPATPGWYPDPSSPSRERYWTGSRWTVATSSREAPAAERAWPPAPRPVPVPAATPHPSTILPANTGPEGPTSALPGADRGLRAGPVILALVVGLVIGALVAGMVVRSSKSSHPKALDESAVLQSMVVGEGDVAPPLVVTGLASGAGLSRPTLDLCNGTFPSESRRTARLQNAAVDSMGQPALSTEAVLYTDADATTQAFGELRAVAAACPRTPVDSPNGGPRVATLLRPPPDRDWPQTATVDRLAFDFVIDDGSGQTLHAVTVYLRRGRALLGVYFFDPDRPQLPVAGQTTVSGIVGVFASRLAALPASAVGS